MGCPNSKPKYARVDQEDDPLLLSKGQAGRTTASGGNGAASMDDDGELDIATISVVKQKVSTPTSARKAAPSTPALTLSERDRKLQELLPIDGRPPDEVFYWLNLPATASTKGMRPQAEAVNPWLFETLRCCHLDRQLLAAVRRLLSKERYACNLLFLGQFNALQEAMHEHLTDLGTELHEIYEQQNLGVQLGDESIAEVIYVRPEFAGKGGDVCQTDVVPGLLDAALFDYDAPEKMDEQVCLHVLMMITLAVNEPFQTQVRRIATPFVKNIPGGFQAAAIKSFSRACNKMHSPDDYRYRKKPRCAYNVDMSRNLVSAATVPDVKALLKALSDEFGGAAKVKNLFSLSQDDRGARYNLLSIMATFVYDAGLTFSELVADPAVQKIWSDYMETGYGGEPRERWTRQVEKAKAFLMSKELENERVKLLCETQVLMEQYVDIRHKMHEPYRVWRAASPGMLYNDFSRAAGIHDFVEDGSTLINACNRGQVNVVKRFLDNGVSVNHQNSANGCTGVYMAAVNGHVDVLHTLVEYGADVNLARDTGASPVYIASERGHLEALRIIIAANADVDTPRHDQWTPIQNAARRKYFDVTKCLIDNNADIFVQTTASNPLNEAISSSETENERLLRDAGATEAAYGM